MLECFIKKKIIDVAYNYDNFFKGKIEKRNRISTTQGWYETDAVEERGQIKLKKTAHASAFPSPPRRYIDGNKIIPYYVISTLIRSHLLSRCRAPRAACLAAAEWKAPKRHWLAETTSLSPLLFSLPLYLRPCVPRVFALVFSRARMARKISLRENI